MKLAMMLGKPSGEDYSSEDEPCGMPEHLYEAFMYACEEAMEAQKSGDSEAFAKAMKNAIMLCVDHAHLSMMGD